MLNVAGTLLAVEDITVLHDRERLLANGVPCHPESSTPLRAVGGTRSVPDCLPLTNIGRCRAPGTIADATLADVQSTVWRTSMAAPAASEPCTNRRRNSGVSIMRRAMVGMACHRFRYD